MNKAKLSYGMWASFLLVALACISLGGLCGWFVAGCLRSELIKEAVLAGVLFGIVVFTMIRQVWRTLHYAELLLANSQSTFPPSLETSASQLGIDRAALVLVNTPQPFALCFGFLKPRICLSTGLVELLSPTQLRAALWHEDYHRQHYDPLRILLLEAIRTALFFLPVAQELCTLLKIKLELDADRYAVGKAGKAALAGALHRLLTTSAWPIQGVVTAGLSANSARIAAILGERSTPQSISSRSILLSAVVLWTGCLLLMF